MKQREKREEEGFLARKGAQESRVYTFSSRRSGRPPSHPHLLGH